MQSAPKPKKKVRIIEVKDGTEADSPFLLSTEKNQSWADLLSDSTTEKKPKEEKKKEKKKAPKYDIEIFEEPNEKEEETEENDKNDEDDASTGSKIFSRLFFFVSLFISALTSGIFVYKKLLPSSFLLGLIAFSAFALFVFGEFSFRKCAKSLSKTVCGFFEIAFSALFGLILALTFTTSNFIDSIEKPASEYSFADISVRKSPFNILFINTDSLGEISEKAENDAIKILTINPISKKVLLATLPTDLSFELSKNEKEKISLRSLGLSGVDGTASSLGSLLDLKFNYYLHTNFKTLEKLVDSIDGINLSAGTYLVLDEENLSCTFYKTKSTRQSGACAVALLREPKAYEGKSEKRLKNQEKVEQGIKERLKNKDTVFNYFDILDSLNSRLETNIPKSRLLEFSNFELDSFPNWKFETASLEKEEDLEAIKTKIKNVSRQSF